MELEKHAQGASEEQDRLCYYIVKIETATCGFAGLSNSDFSDYHIGVL